jgi:hypothetical protein
MTQQCGGGLQWLSREGNSGGVTTVWQWKSIVGHGDEGETNAISVAA